MLLVVTYDPVAWPWKLLCLICSAGLGIAICWWRLDRDVFKAKKKIDAENQDSSLAKRKYKLVTEVQSAKLRPHTGDSAHLRSLIAAELVRPPYSEQEYSEDEIGFFGARLASRSLELFHRTPDPSSQETAKILRTALPVPLAPGKSATEDEKTKHAQEVTLATMLHRVEADDEQRRQDLEKILQPEYAIGAGIISRDDYNNLKNDYFALSEISPGLIVPLLLACRNPLRL